MEAIFYEGYVYKNMKGKTFKRSQNESAYLYISDCL